MGGPMGGGGMGMMGGMRGPNSDDMRKQMGAMQNQMGAGMRGMAGMPGMARGPGAAGGAGAGAGASAGGASVADSGPADFHSPAGAVRSFLNALKAKDLDRLNESTALRASFEAGSTKNQELFKKIIDLNLSDSELDDIAKKLEGFTVAGENPPKSTGRVDVVIQKAGERSSWIRRKVTVRHEKKGWGVLDIGGPQVFKTPGVLPARTKSSGRNY
jgi:hypothetical protein